MGHHYYSYYERNPFAVEFDQHRAKLRNEAMLHKQLETRMKDLDAKAESIKVESRKRNKKVLLCL